MASAAYHYADAYEVQKRGERHALFTNIALGTTAALSAVSISLLIRDFVARPSSVEQQEAAAGIHRPRRRGFRIGARPVSGGGAVILSLPF